MISNMLSGFRKMGLMGAVLLTGTAHAQSASVAHAAFEVASIRPAAAEQGNYEGSSRSQIEPAADGLTMRNIDLGEMVEWAYELEHYQLEGPTALQGQRYDVRARAAGRWRWVCCG
jgi:hypothetical protein